MAAQNSIQGAGQNKSTFKEWENLKASFPKFHTLKWPGVNQKKVLRVPKETPHFISRRATTLHNFMQVGIVDRRIWWSQKMWNNRSGCHSQSRRWFPTTLVIDVHRCNIFECFNFRSCFPHAEKGLIPFFSDQQHLCLDIQVSIYSTERRWQMLLDMTKDLQFNFYGENTLLLWSQRSLDCYFISNALQRSP